jgi:hypothetical protein
MAEAIVKIVWLMSPVIVAMVAFNFWRMIQAEVERNK